MATLFQMELHNESEDKRTFCRVTYFYTSHAESVMDIPTEPDESES